MIRPLPLLRAGTVLLGVLYLLAAPAAAAETAAPVVFSDSYGPMTPKYQRELSGLTPEEPNLEAWRARLLTLRNLKDATLKRLGDRIHVELIETPHWTFAPKPLPFVLPVGLELGAEDWRLGGHYYDFKGWAGYIWSGVTLYDADRTGSERTGSLTYNYPEAWARAGVMVWPYTRVYLEGRAAGAAMDGNPAIASAYGSTQGAIGTISPFVRYDDTNHPDIPQWGSRAKAGMLWGPQWLGNSGSFLRYDGYLQHYIPFGKWDSLALGLHGGVADGNLPLAQIYWLGGGNFLRGYSSSRFIGNQMLAFSAEYRHALFPDIAGTGLTIWSTAFVDAARSWNRGAAIAFPQDIRPAVGGYLGASWGSWYIGRLEAAIGNEGPFVNIGAGLPFPW